MIFTIACKKFNIKLNNSSICMLIENLYTCTCTYESKIKKKTETILFTENKTIEKNKLVVSNCCSILCSVAFFSYKTRVYNNV